MLKELLPLKTNGAVNRRRLKLSFLEMVALGFAVVVVAGLWLLVYRGGPPGGAADNPALAPAPPTQQLDRALAASEKVLAQLADLQKEIELLKKAQQEGAQATAGGASAEQTGVSASRVSSLTNRVRDLEVWVASGGKEGKAAQEVAANLTREMSQTRQQSEDVTRQQTDLRQRVEELGQGLAATRQALEKTQGQAAAAVAPTQLAQLTQRLDKLEASAGSAPAAAAPDRALVQRLDKLEAALAQRGADPAEKEVLSALAQRMDRLEESLTQAAKGTSAELSGRLAKVAELEKHLEEVRQLADQAANQPVEATQRRLDALEKAVAQNDQRERQAAQTRDRLAEVTKTLEDLRKDVGRARDGLSPLDQRLAKLEQQTGRLDQAVKDAGQQDEPLRQTMPRLTAQLHTLEDDLRTLDRRVLEEKSAQAAARERLKGVEEMVDTLSRRDGATKADQQIENRLGALEKKLTSGTGPQALPYADLVARLERLERRSASQSAVAGAATGGQTTADAKLLDALDRRLEELARRQRELDQEVGQLDRKMTATATATQAPKAAPRAAPPEEDDKVEPTQGDTQVVNTVTHRVRSGETLYRLAQRYGVKVDDIRRWNPKLQERATLYIGEKLVIHVGG